MKYLAYLLCLALMTAASGRCLGAEPATPDGWTPAFTANFDGGKPVEEDFTLIYGQAKTVDGKAVLQREKRRQRLMVFVDQYQFPKSVRADLTVSVTTDKKPQDLVVGVALHADGFDHTTSYLLLVGAKGNTSALLKKNNAIIDSTVTGNVTLQSGQSHHIVAQYDAGTISLTFDGKAVFTYTDAQPITNPENAWVGLYAPGCTLTIEKLVVSTHGGADEVLRQSTDIPQGPVVTLKGMAVCSLQSAPTPTAGDHLVQFYAYEGTPEVKATMDALLDKEFPESMDFTAAQNFQKKMDEQARYFLAPCNLSRRNHDQIHVLGLPLAVTGVIYEKDGRKWVWPTKIAETKLTFPPKMLSPDKPLVMPRGDPITLKVADNMTLQCLPIPAGRFLLGAPFYVTRWKDEFPHEVILTRPYYLAEHPITQEMFQAVMGHNPSQRINPQAPVEHVSYDDIGKFCRILSEKNGRVVRLTTHAEWEYAARVGTSNPCLTEKYDLQNCHAKDSKEAVPVKTKAPNAWGLYDMLGAGSEDSSDWTGDNVRIKMMDPQGPDDHDPGTHEYGNGPTRMCNGGYYDDYRPSMHGNWDKDGVGAEGITTFRVLVEAEAPVKPR
jgi:formylglycine-generating enzyme required for sulfatase activity